MIIIFLLCLSPGFISPVWAQEESKEPVSYSIQAPDKICAGEHFKITTIFDIREGWHVYALIDGNIGMGKSVTRVSFKLPEGIKTVGPLQLPKGAIYTGKGIQMTQKFQLAKEVPKGKLNIIVKIVYQCCNEEMCYPPVRKKVNITIEVK